MYGRASTRASARSSGENTPVAEPWHGGVGRPPHDVLLAFRRAEDVGDPGQELQALPGHPIALDGPFQFLHGLLTLGGDGDLLGHVPRASRRTGDRAVLVLNDVTLAPQPMHGAVGPDDAMLDRVGTPGLEGLLNGRHRSGSVVGVDRFDPCLEGSVEPAMIDAEQLRHHGIPDDDATRPIP